MMKDSKDQFSIAVIGAGASGLMAARTLADSGLRVSVFDKSRGLGGRLATRRVGGFAFDHGCPVANIDDPTGLSVVRRLETMDAAALWEPMPGFSGFVGTPGNSAMLKPLAEPLTVHRGLEVAAVERDAEGGGWMLIPKNELVQDKTAQDEARAALGPFDWVLVTAPAPQTHALLEGLTPIAARVAEAGMEPRWTVMVVPDGSLNQGSAEVIAFDDEILERAIRNDRKPGRSGAESWVVQARRDWSIANLELDKDQARDAVLAAFRKAIPQGDPIFAAAHRWRFSEVSAPLGVPCLLDPDLGLGAAGDWCVGPCVADALESGRALADELLKLIFARAS